MLLLHLRFEAGAQALLLVHSNYAFEIMKWIAKEFSFICCVYVSLSPREKESEHPSAGLLPSVHSPVAGESSHHLPAGSWRWRMEPRNSDVGFGHVGWCLALLTKHVPPFVDFCLLRIRSSLTRGNAWVLFPVSSVSSMPNLVLALPGHSRAPCCSLSLFQVCS